MTCRRWTICDVIQDYYFVRFVSETGGNCGDVDDFHFNLSFRFSTLSNLYLY